MSVVSTLLISSTIMACPAIKVVEDADHDIRAVRSIEQRCIVNTSKPCLSTLFFFEGHYTAFCGIIIPGDEEFRDITFTNNKDKDKKDEPKKPNDFCASCHPVKPSHGGDTSSGSKTDYQYQWSGDQLDYLYRQSSTKSDGERQ